MKRRLLFWTALLICGIVMVVIPFHVEFTGYVLILLSLGGLVRRFLPYRIRRPLTAAMLISSAILLAAMAFIAGYGWNAAPLPDCDCVVVLGAQTQGDQPAPVLKERLDRALSYVQEHPDTPVVLSGGQGPDEDRPEADVMFAYMVSHGADPALLHTEIQSSTTLENLQNTKAMVEGANLPCKRINIITSEFHQCRAQYLAEKLGMEAGGIPSHTENPFFLVNYCLREAFSFVKAAVQTR